MLLTSCVTPGPSTASKIQETQIPPHKVADLPSSEIQFAKQDLLVIAEHGDSLCKMLNQMKDPKVTSLANKLCEEQSSWLGYTSTDGFKNDTELFIGNRNVIRDVFGKAAATAGKAGNIAIQRLILMESTEFEQDLKLISGEKMQSFESSMDRAKGADGRKSRREQYEQFTAWVLSLNDFYRH